MPLTILLNGQAKSLDVSTPTLSGLVQHLGFQPDRIAVEVNGTIIPRVQWPKSLIEEGDKVELVQFVGGGLPSKSVKSFSQRSP